MMLPTPSNRPVSGLLLLEDGSVFEGEAASPGTRFGEVVFNTSMTGYQEVLTDPSYAGQIVAMTYPQIGNYGVNADDAESASPWAEGFIVRELTARPSSNFRSDEEPRSPTCARHGVPASRASTRAPWCAGCANAARCAACSTTERSRRRRPRRRAGRLPDHGRARPGRRRSPARRAMSWPRRRHRRRRRALPPRRSTTSASRATSCARWPSAARGSPCCPARTPAADVLALRPDGVFLSNGPGDPEPLAYAVDTVRGLLAAKVPIFGICLGHQLLGLALGGDDLQAQVRPPRRQPAGARTSPPAGSRSPARTTASPSTPRPCPPAAR